MARSSTLTQKIAQRLFILPLVFVLNSGEGRAQESTFDRDVYYRAVDYCRGRPVLGVGVMKVSGPMALSPDGQILCFDGRIADNVDLSLAKDLKEDGLFVVRSPGGSSASAVALSSLIRARHATVVIYDFCFSACANFFLIASSQTYVLKRTLVVWHNPHGGDPNRPYCSSLVTPRGGGPPKLRRGPCRNTTFGDQAAYSAYSPAEIEFFKERTVDLLFDAPPQSFYVRKIVAGLFAETGVYREIAWTIHPRYYPRWFKTKIFYEAYPESQDEVDKMRAALGLNIRVIYDPGN